MSTFAQLLDLAWQEHGDAPEAVADRLEATAAQLTAADDAAAYARIVTHVMGEHLGAWDRGIALLDVLARDAARVPAAAAQAAVRRGIATLRHCAGAPDALAGLAEEDRASALAVAASALCARGSHDPAIAAYAQAASSASALPPQSPAWRALGAGGNNLAVALEQHPGRTESQTQGMLDAAQHALMAWQRAGTWLEEERAQYRLACSRIAAGDAPGALDAAGHCVRICAEHDAPAFEQFFGYAVLARAARMAHRDEAFATLRAEALAWFLRVPEDERHHCTADMAAIAG